jgi:hypothetical protein
MPTPKTTTPDDYWLMLWRSLVADAVWHPDFGHERYWRANFERLGYPLHAAEMPYDDSGTVRAARFYSKGKLVLWMGDRCEERPLPVEYAA